LRATAALLLLALLSFWAARGQAESAGQTAQVMVPRSANDKLQEANRQENPAEKLRILREAEALFKDPALKYSVLYPALVDAYVAVGDIDRAAEVIDRMLSAGAPPLAVANARVSLARGYVNRKQYGPAVKQLDLAIASFKRSGEGTTPPAAKHVRSLLAVLNVRSLLAALDLQGEALLEQGDAQRALTVLQEFEGLRKSRRIDPSPRVLANIGRAFARQGVRNDALLNLAEAYCLAAHRVNAIKRHGEVVGTAAGEYSQELAEQQQFSDWVKDEMSPVWASSETQQSLDDFLNQKLNTYDEGVLAQAKRSAKADKPAPDFNLSTVTGTKVRLSDLRGKVVLLNFWDTTCKPCRAEYPHLAKIQDEFRDKAVVILMINLDEDTTKVKPFAEKYGFTAQVLLKDSAIQHAYGIGAIPHTVIIDKFGAIRFNEVGFTLDTPEIFRAEITSLLAGREAK
jgi:pentatricopeptide repeat protein